MKVLPFTITKSEKDALLLQEDLGASFYGVLHQHEELQISYIKQGEGSVIVGDSVNAFESGNLLILGSNLPHVFKSAPSQEDSHMISVFFTKNSFGNDFFKTEELKSLTSFFRKADNGFKLVSPNSNLTSMFGQLQKASKLDRFILFFQLLKDINTAKYEPLSSFISAKKYTDNEGKRMNSVFQYTMEHFREKITLNDISREATMTSNAFCNYFKKRTRKTYVEFLTEIRIEEAAKLLRTQPEISVSDIAERSGFQNLSNFNRKFKALKGSSPLQFKKLITST